MKFDLESVESIKRWHVPCSIATLAMGIYLMLVYLVPSFGQGYHEMLFRGDMYKLLPYAMLILIGSPLYSLWCYTKLDTDEKFRELCFDQDNE